MYKWLIEVSTDLDVGLEPRRDFPLVLGRTILANTTEIVVVTAVADDNFSGSVRGPAKRGMDVLAVLAGGVQRLVLVRPNV
jgi:hypothetical protein